MTRKTIVVVLSFLLSLSLYSCGEECGVLCGSQCDGIDCTVHEVLCDLYIYQEDIKVTYRATIEGVNKITATLTINVSEVDKVEGYLFEGQEFTDWVTFDRPDLAWPELTGTMCQINQGGDEADKPFSGKCGFLFVGGTTLTANFSCQLMGVDL